MAVVPALQYPTKHPLYDLVEVILPVKMQSFRVSVPFFIQATIAPHSSQDCPVELMVAETHTFSITSVPQEAETTPPACAVVETIEPAT
jgi:hypothetical protein